MRKPIFSALTAFGAVALLLISQFVVVYLWIAADVLICGTSFSRAASSVNDHTVLLTLLSALVTLYILAVTVKLRKKPILATAHLMPMKPSLWPACLMLGLGLNMVVTVMLNRIPFPEEWIESYSKSSSALAVDNIWLYLVAVVIATPLTEEVVFRRLAYGGFKQCMPPVGAALLSAVMFGLCHGTLLWMIYTVPIALIMCYIYKCCGSLWGSVMLHIGFNAGSLLIELTSTPAYLINNYTVPFVLTGLALCAGGVALIIKNTRQRANSCNAADGDDTPMEK